MMENYNQLTDSNQSQIFDLFSLETFSNDLIIFADPLL